MDFPLEDGLPSPTPGKWEHFFTPPTLYRNYVLFIVIIARESAALKVSKQERPFGSENLPAVSSSPHIPGIIRMKTRDP